MRHLIPSNLKVTVKQADLRRSNNHITLGTLIILPIRTGLPELIIQLLSSPPSINNNNNQIPIAKTKKYTLK
jgi:hypothetical protein